MKVAHLNPGKRGIASYALNIYKYAIKHDIETLIVSEAPWKKERINLFEPDSLVIADIFPWTKHIPQVVSKLKEFSPDILHHHHPCGRLDFYVKYIQEKLNVPLICTFHLSIGSRDYFIDKVMNTYFKLARRNFLKAKAYVAISKKVKEQLIEIGGVPANRIVLLYAGVNPDIYKPQQYKPHKTLNITFVGEIMHEKGIDLLISAVKEVSKSRELTLTIIGKGPLKPLLEKQTKNIPYIKWIGFLSKQAEVAEYMAKSDVVVLPTRWQEAFSYIPLESMSSGTPVIATNAGGTPEVIKHGETGFLFERGNIDELIEILKNVDIENLWEMGLKGREYILKKHTLDLFGQKYKSLYENVLNDPGNIKQID